MEWIEGKMVTEVESIGSYTLAGEDITIVLTGGNAMPKSIGTRFKITFEEIPNVKLESDPENKRHFEDEYGEYESGMKYDSD